jgi:hypothetical protein
MYGGADLVNACLISGIGRRPGLRAELLDWQLA